MQPSTPQRPGRHGTGTLVVLTVIAVLGGAAFLGGTLALAERTIGLVGAGRGEAPSGSEAPMAAADLVDALREDHSIGSRLDTTAELCVQPEESAEHDPFFCTSAMDTDVVRIVAFESAGVALEAARAMREAGEAPSGGDAQDTRDACHFVLVWFEHHGLGQGERDAMAADATSEADC